LLFEILLTREAEQQYAALHNPAQKVVLKAVEKMLKLMGMNLRHPSLKTHEFHGLSGPDGEKIFESYAQNRTAGAYRIFWYYGPGKAKLTILAITPHP
jgi:hypothetical protein